MNWRRLPSSSRRRQIDRPELSWAVDAECLAVSGYHQLAGSRRPVDLLRHHCDMAEGAVHDRRPTRCR